MIDLSCVIAAIFFVVGNITQMSYYHSWHAAEKGTFNEFVNLKPEILMERWAERSDLRILEVVSGFMRSIAWLTFIIPVARLAWINSLHGTRQIGLHVTALVLAVGGSMTEMTARLLHVGSRNAMEWLADEFNLSKWIDKNEEDDIGWRVLEMTQVVVRGMLLWVDAAEWLLLGGILILICRAVYRQPENDRVFNMRWARFGACVAAVCLLDFCAEILRFKAFRTFALTSLIISSLNRFVFLPIWFIWLAIQLPRAEKSSEVTQPLLVKEEDEEDEENETPGTQNEGTEKFESIPTEELHASN